MSTLSEQDQLNPKDPRYYAPRWLRQKAGSQPVNETDRDTPFSPASFESESNVSHALLQRLDPEIMHEPGYELDSGKALRSITVRFAAAVGIAAVVALFFVVVVPASRQPADGETASPTGIVQSIKTALFQSGETEAAPSIAPTTAPKPAREEPQAVAASAKSNPATTGQSGQLLNQFMQWRQKPAP
jgi:hypothetical protein